MIQMVNIHKKFIKILKTQYIDKEIHKIHEKMPSLTTSQRNTKLK